MSSVPAFAGMSGKKLMWSVTTCATMGFLLFGYDRMYSNLVLSRPTRDQFDEADSVGFFKRV